jgi:hypothetical protein
MEKYTQKQLKSLVNSGVAVDISGCDNDDRFKILAEEGDLIQIGYARGTYGCSGMLFKGYTTKKLYAITGRTQAIFLFG